MDAEGLLKLYPAPLHWPSGLPFTAILLGLNNSPEPLPVRTFWKSHSLWRHRRSGVWVADWLGTADYDRRRRITANPPKPTARSERAEGSGTNVNNGDSELFNERNVFAFGGGV